MSTRLRSAVGRAWCAIAVLLAIMVTPPVGAQRRATPAAKTPPAGPRLNASKTLLGLFNPSSPASATALGARAVRLILFGPTLVADAEKDAQLLAGYKNAGFTVIVTVSKWTGKGGRLPSPTSDTGAALLATFETFLRANGHFIDYCTLDNEPMFDVDAADFVSSRTATEAPVVQWYRALAAVAQGVFKKDPALARLRISAPALNDIQRDAEGKRTQTSLINTLLDWETGDPNIDVVDVHLHVSTVDDVNASTAFMIRKTRKPLIVTEWSQAGAVRAWLKSTIARDFAAKWHVATTLTNREFIDACYQQRVSKIEWDEFVHGAPYDPAFMSDAFDAMVRNGVTVAAYGAEMQYGNAMFDSKQLIANLTVAPAGSHQENYQFANWYRALAARLK